MSKELKHGKPFGGKLSEEQNLLYNVIAELGYDFFEETPKATMTVFLLEEIHKFGYELKPTNDET